MLAPHVYHLNTNFWFPTNMTKCEIHLQENIIIYSKCMQQRFKHYYRGLTGLRHSVSRILSRQFQLRHLQFQTSSVLSSLKDRAATYLVTPGNL